jgi:hypothetical protein
VELKEPVKYVKLKAPVKQVQTKAPVKQVQTKAPVKQVQTKAPVKKVPAKAGRAVCKDKGKEKVQDNDKGKEKVQDNDKGKEKVEDKGEYEGQDNMNNLFQQCFEAGSRYPEMLTVMKNTWKESNGTVVSTKRQKL